VLGATWQRCSVHFMRNALAYVNARQRGMVAAAIRTAFAQETEKEVHTGWAAVRDRSESDSLVSSLSDSERIASPMGRFPRKRKRVAQYRGTVMCFLQLCRCAAGTRSRRSVMRDDTP
jgi:transposase-like protein